MEFYPYNNQEGEFLDALEREIDSWTDDELETSDIKQALLNTYNEIVTYENYLLDNDFSGLIDPIEKPSKPIGKLTLTAILADFIQGRAKDIDPIENTLRKPDLSGLRGIRLEPKHPIRQKRKQWAGEPTVRTVEPNFDKMRAYIKRSMNRQIKKIDMSEQTVDMRSRFEAVRRSLAHRPLKMKPIGVIHSAKVDYEQATFNAYFQFGHELMRQKQPSSAMRDAWDEYIPKGVVDEFLRDTFEPIIPAFNQLPALLNEFIASEWQNYNERAFEARQQRYGMNLTEDDVNQLSDADLSILSDGLGIPVEWGYLDDD